MPTEKELRSLYQIGVASTYARDREMKIMARFKHGKNIAEIYKKIMDLTDDCEEVIALDYDIGRFQNELVVAKARITSEPERGKALSNWLIGIMDKQKARLKELLDMQPDKKEAVRKLLE